ncbi:MAG: DUF1476 domain-containing protein [Rhodospirillaceae bacterium]|jgi:hypothetical protein|nr:DUF1476 domain-containing protein [Rhodospirillaceae bacterium]MBT6118667.1 DUF1476 domain-containing protein [Rhodospirillaceae bacterium]
MSSFDNREKGYEAKFKRDKELEFKCHARRNKLLGLWAAELMGMDAAEAEAYAKQVVISDFEEPGDEDVYRKVFGDLTGKGVEIAEHKLRKEMSNLLAVAHDQIVAESGA